MVIAVGALKEGKLDYVRNDIAAVVKAAKGKTVKVIIETAYLTDEEKVTACKLSAEAGAHFVKTCTGFSNAKDAENKATVHDIELMKKSIPASMKVKASGGIRSYEDAMALIEAGADRLGTSAGVKIVEC
jgi:deoxyribose-phosphate aldolase